MSGWDYTPEQFRPGDVVATGRLQRAETRRLGEQNKIDGFHFEVLTATPPLV